MTCRRSFLQAVLSAAALSSLAATGLTARAQGYSNDEGTPRAAGDSGSMSNPDGSRSDGSRRMGQVVDDQTLETKVKTALIGSDQVKARNIEVEVRDGITYLSGNVNSAAEARAAVATAERVSGVKSVKSTLVVQSPQ